MPIDVSKIHFLYEIKSIDAPEDYRLIQGDEPDTFILLSDHSLWKRCYLYYLENGDEMGFYRLPLPEFDDLVDLVMNSEIDSNRDGAAEVLMRDYKEQVLEKSLEIIKSNQNDLSKYKDFFMLLRLDHCINRSPILGKAFDEILRDYSKWKYIADQIGKIH